MIKVDENRGNSKEKDEDNGIDDPDKSRLNESHDYLVAVEGIEGDERKTIAECRRA